MKKFILMFLISTLVIVAPLGIVLSAGYYLRDYFGRPFYYVPVSAYDAGGIEYAKIKADCPLFKTSDITDRSYRNVMFILPESYFVLVLKKVSNTISRVDYGGRVGYVDSSKIKSVDFVPIDPTLEGIYFDIGERSGTHIRSTPDAEDASNILDVVHAGAKQLMYVGEIVGEIPTGGTTNIWYLAVWTPSSSPTSVIEGYVYSERTTNLTPIKANGEDMLEVENNDKEPEKVVFSINNTVKTILIVLICLPIILVFILLVVSNRKSKGSKKSKELENQIKKSSKPDLDAEKGKRLRSKISKIEDLEGQSLHRKETFLKKKRAQSTAALKPVFPTYEVIDDDDLL